MRLLQHFLGQPSPVLAGERVTLRLPRRSDYAAWRAVREESRLFLTPWEPSWPEDELERVGYTARLGRYREELRERSGYTFFLFDEPTGALCGGITLGQIRRGVAQTGTIGYWMGERFAGTGRMSEALALVCRFAFTTEALHRVEAACLPRNERSSRLLLRAGFREEGLLRRYLKIAGVWEDHRLYALLAEDWSSRGAHCGRERNERAPLSSHA